MGKYYSNGDINGTWRSGRKLADDGKGVLTLFYFQSDLLVPYIISSQDRKKTYLIIHFGCRYRKFLIMVVHAVSMFLAEYNFLIHIHKKFITAWFIYFAINYRIVSNTEYIHFRFKIAPNFNWMEQIFLDLVTTVARFSLIQATYALCYKLKQSVY